MMDDDKIAGILKEGDGDGDDGDDDDDIYIYIDGVFHLSRK